MTCLTYPIGVENGKLLLTYDEPQKVSEALKQSLLTVFEERIRLPEYGLNAELFETIGNTRSVEEAVRDAISVGLENYPIKNVRLKVEIGEGITTVKIFYDYDNDTDLVEEIYF